MPKLKPIQETVEEIVARKFGEYLTAETQLQFTEATDSFRRETTAELIAAIKEHVFRLAFAPRRIDYCRGCNAKLWFLPNVKGGTTPFDELGNNHFVTCPNAKEFHK